MSSSLEAAVDGGECGLAQPVQLLAQAGEAVARVAKDAVDAVWQGVEQQLLGDVAVGISREK